MMYNFRLRSTVSRNSSVDPRDTLSTKRALSTLGHYSLQKNLEQYGITDFVDEGMFDGIRSFQRQKGLKEDGLMRKGGPTERMLDTSLSAVTRQRQKTIKQRLDQIRKPDTARTDQRRNSLVDRSRERNQPREVFPRRTTPPIIANPDPRKPPNPWPAPRPDRGSDVFGIILDALGFPTLEEKRKQQEEQGGRHYPHYPQPTTKPEGKPETRFPDKVGRGGKNPNSKGTQLVKTALTMLGYAFDDKRQPNKDDDGTDLGFAIENFQSDFNLKRDGFLRPGGETAKKIAELITPMADASRDKQKQNPTQRDILTQLAKPFSDLLSGLGEGLVPTAHAESPEHASTELDTDQNQSQEQDEESTEQSQQEKTRQEWLEERENLATKRIKEMGDEIAEKYPGWHGLSLMQQQAIVSTLSKEGDRSDDKDDSGGLTQNGASQNLLDSIHGNPEFSEFHRWLPKDARKMNPGLAAKLYAEYFMPRMELEEAEINELSRTPEGRLVYGQIADAYFNSGEKNGGVFLQISIDRAHKDGTNLMDRPFKSEPPRYTGDIGPVTRAKLLKALKSEDGPAKLLVAMAKERKIYYAEIICSDPTQKKYINGWNTRAGEGEPHVEGIESSKHTSEYLQEIEKQNEGKPKGEKNCKYNRKS